MQDGSGAGKDGDDLFFRGEGGIGCADIDGILAERNGVEMKFAVGVRLRGQMKIGRLGFQSDLSAGNRTMLWVVNDAADGAKNGGSRSDGVAEQKQKC